MFIIANKMLIYCVGITILNYLALWLNLAFQFSIYSAFLSIFRPSSFLIFRPSGFGLPYQLAQKAIDVATKIEEKNEKSVNRRRCTTDLSINFRISCRKNKLFWCPYISPKILDITERLKPQKRYFI